MDLTSHNGHTHKRIFTVKEAYNLKTTTQLLDKDVVWEGIWHTGYWPKICAFLWLVHHGYTLTWDNFIKRGFSEPSFYPLCSQEG
jgi:hypothetical protein